MSAYSGHCANAVHRYYQWYQVDGIMSMAEGDAHSLQTTAAGLNCVSL